MFIHKTNFIFLNVLNKHRKVGKAFLSSKSKNSRTDSNETQLKSTARKFTLTRKSVHQLKSSQLFDSYHATDKHTKK